jgi:8-oxo-dGTP pyrophosphatase MutT (NUDIX family)
MIRSRSAGGVVLGDSGTIALVMSENSGSWLFPKGHVDPGESDEDAARREIREEAGLDDLEYLADLGEFIRPRVDSGSGGYEEKVIHMFLFAAPMGAALSPSNEIREARWVPYREVPTVLGTPHPEWFGADRAWFASVFERVQGAIQRD